MQGRVWYSSHRGRLWIAAASKVPSDDEIACLLGCVDVLDCLPQDEYREKVCMFNIRSFRILSVCHSFSFSGIVEGAVLYLFDILCALAVSGW